MTTQEPSRNPTRTIATPEACQPRRCPSLPRSLVDKTVSWTQSCRPRSVFHKRWLQQAETVMADDDEVGWHGLVVVFGGEGRQTDILSECYWWFCYKVLDFASILFVIDALQAPVSWKKRLFLQQRVKSWSGNERSSKRLLKQFVKLPSDYAACKLDLEGLHTYNVPYSFYSQRVVQFWNLSSHGWVLPPLESAYWRDVRYCGSQI